MTRTALLAATAGLLLLTACGGGNGGGANQDGGSSVTLGAFAFSVDEGGAKTESKSGKAPSGRSFWSTRVTMRNTGGAGPASLDAPVLAFTVATSDTKITPAHKEQTGLLNTNVPAPCTLNGVTAELSQTVDGTLLDTENYPGIPQDQCVFPLTYEGVRVPDDAQTAPETIPDGDSEQLQYSTTYAFTEGDLPGVRYWAAPADQLQQRNGDYVEVPAG